MNKPTQQDIIRTALLTPQPPPVCPKCGKRHPVCVGKRIGKAWVL